MSFLTRLGPKSSESKRVGTLEPAVILPLFPAQIPQAEVKASVPLPNLSPKELLENFESIGNNCEFGLLQRHFGVEQISLLRWAGMSFDNLCHALELRFEGFGNVLSFHKLGTEYISEEKTYHAVFHTEKHVGKVDPTQLEISEKKRLNFLARAFMELVEDGSRILVYKGTKQLTWAEVDKLNKILKKIGPSTLLWVTLSDDQYPPGTVRWTKNGIIRGYIDRFSPDEAVPSYCSFDVWVEICRSARQLWRTTSS